MCMALIPKICKNENMNVIQTKNGKVVFFDLYQTLIDVELSVNNPNHEIRGWDVLAKSLHKYGKEISGLEIQKMYAQRRNDFYSGNDKKISHHNLLAITTQVLEKDIGLKLTTDEVVALIYEYRRASRGHLRLYPKVFEVLSQLSKKYVLSTASHTQGCFTQLELRELGIENFFSYFIYTSDIGFRKESIEFYKYCLKAVGKEAGDCVTIGDNYDVDMLVPKQLGIKAIWLKNPLTSERYLNLIQERPENVINLAEFDKLPEVIDKIFNN